MYNKNGEEGGEYAKIFEEEYIDALNEFGLIDKPEYKNYLDGIPVQKNIFAFVNKAILFVKSTINLNVFKIFRYCK